MFIVLYSIRRKWNGIWEVNSNWTGYIFVFSLGFLCSKPDFQLRAKCLLKYTDIQTEYSE